MMNLQVILKQFGLNEKESLIYLTLLSQGPTPASVLSYRTNIKRSTAQCICQQLEKKGLIFFERKERTYFYKCKAPDQILNLPEQQRQSLTQKTNQTSLLIGELNALASPKLLSSNWVKFYRGLDEVFKSYMEFLNGVGKDKEICNYVSPATVVMQDFRKGMRQFIKQRIRKQIFCKTICAYCEDAIRLKLTDDYSFRKTLVTFENARQPFFSEILLSSDRILGASYSGDVVFSYQMFDKDIAAMHQFVFNLAWQQARLDDVKICQTKKAKNLMDSLRGIRDY